MKEPKANEYRCEDCHQIVPTDSTAHSEWNEQTSNDAGDLRRKDSTIRLSVFPRDDGEVLTLRFRRETWTR